MCLQDMLLHSLSLVGERWANISLALPRIPAGVGTEWIYQHLDIYTCIVRWSNLILSNHRTFLEHLHGLPLDGHEYTDMKKGVLKGLAAQMERLMHNQEIPLHSDWCWCGEEHGGLPPHSKDTWLCSITLNWRVLGVAWLGTSPYDCPALTLKPMTICLHRPDLSLNLDLIFPSPSSSFIWS